MKLQFSGSPDIPEPRAKVWARLMDPQAVGRAAPGVESLEVIDATHFKAVAAVGVGAIKLRLTVHITVSDLVEPERAAMLMEGKAPGSQIQVQTGLRLEELGSMLTRLHWQAEATVSGAVASVGARLLEGTARKMAERFWIDFAAGGAARPL